MRTTGGLGSEGGVVDSLGSFSPFFPLRGVRSSLFSGFSLCCRFSRSVIHDGSEFEFCDLVSQVVSDDVVVFGADESSVVVALDAPKSGDETPDGVLTALLSDLVRSTAVSFTGTGTAFEGSSDLRASLLVMTVASTSSAQFPFGPSSENWPVAGVAVPEVTLLEEACDAAARPFAACAYEKPLGL